MNVKKIKGEIMVITIKGRDSENLSNTYVICRFSSVFIVDPSHDYEKIIEAIGSRNVLGILLTHCHYDHTGLIHKFDCPIYISGDEYLGLFDESIYLSRNKPKYLDYKLDIIKVNDNDLIPFCGEDIKVIATPGHTRGSVCYLIDNCLFSGDTLFLNDYGRCDLKTGSKIEMNRSLKKLLKLPISLIVYPGHDEKTSIKNERKYFSDLLI
jgi:glyoxylase-like metal-dependent hydrolase (beta-lactamase superfamily II)